MNTQGQIVGSHEDVITLKERIESAEKRIAELELNLTQDLQLIRDYIKGFRIAVKSNTGRLANDAG